MSGLTSDKRDGVATVTLARSEARNALTGRMVAALRASLADAVADDKVRVVVLRAEGDDFSVGDDFNEIVAPGGQGEGFMADLQDVSRLMMLGPKPVVVAAQGWILGGTVSWLLNADFCIVADTARAYSSESRWGLFQSGGASYLLPARVGAGLANEVLFLGRKLDAEALVSCGLARERVTAEALRERTEELAAELVALPPTTQRWLKRAQRIRIERDLEAALALETKCCMSAARDPETQARLRAFLERSTNRS